MNTNKTSSNPNTLVTGDADRIIAGILAWLTDPNGTQNCTVTGGPGAGKTWMIQKLLSTYKNYQKIGMGNTDKELIICGTTHESLAVIKKSLNDDKLRTIYSLLGLVPNKGKICKRDGKFKRDENFDPDMLQISPMDDILVCDEANYIPQEALTIIRKWFPKLRVIYIGSEHQLGTDSGPSQIFQRGWANFYLNTAYRADNADVQAVYDSSEEDVINQSFPRFVENDSIIYLGEDDWYATLQKAYTSPMADNCITLAYTNERVYELNGLIRGYQGKAGNYDTVGAKNQALRAGSALIPKKGVFVKKDAAGKYYIPVKTSKGDIVRSYVAESYEHYKQLCSRSHQREINEIYPSLIASTQAMTIHGAQGGTWDYTFLDLVNLTPLRYRDMETFRRAKHVAESRHKTKLFVKVK